MSDETVTVLAKLALPWSKEVEVHQLAYESGLKMLRLRFKEGRARFTMIDIDAATARTLGGLLAEWGKDNG